MSVPKMSNPDELCENFSTIDIHPGITYAQIKQKILDIIKINSKTNYVSDFVYVIFLDEINTNPNICGILKDIQIDG